MFLSTFRRFFLLLLVILAHLGEAKKHELTHAKFNKYFGLDNSLCAFHKQPPTNPMGEGEKEDLQTSKRITGHIHPLVRTEKECRGLPHSEWIEIFPEPTFRRALEDQHEKSKTFWRRRRQRRRLQDGEKEGSIWIMELQDKVHLTQKQATQISSLLGAKLKHVINKPDVVGGSFFQVYTTESAIDRLLDEFEHLIQSVSPLPDELKIDSVVRALVRAHPERSGKEIFEHNIEVFLADGVKNPDIVAEDISFETKLNFKVETYEFLHADAEMKLSEIQNIANILSQDPRVLKVTVRPQMELMNHWGAQILQSGSQGGPANGDATYEAYPFHTRGIIGDTQVVGVADSGLDYGSCYFQDQSRPISTLAQGTEFEDLSQRKILQYIAFADGTEGETTGHGYVLHYFKFTHITTHSHTLRHTHTQTHTTTELMSPDRFLVLPITPVHVPHLVLV